MSLIHPVMKNSLGLGLRLELGLTLTLTNPTTLSRVADPPRREKLGRATKDDKKRRIERHQKRPVHLPGIHFLSSYC